MDQGEEGEREGRELSLSLSLGLGRVAKLAGGRPVDNISTSSPSSQARESLPEVRRDLRDVSKDKVDTCFSIS